MIGTAQHIGGFRHEVHAAKHHIGPIGSLLGQLRQYQGIAAEIGMLDDFVALVVVTQNHHPIAERAFGRTGPFEEFFGRQRLIVSDGPWERGDCFHLQPFG